MVAPLVLSDDLHQSLERPALPSVHEPWPDQAAHTRHVATAHGQAINAPIKDVHADPDRVVITALTSTPAPTGGSCA